MAVRRAVLHSILAASGLAFLWPRSRTKSSETLKPLQPEKAVPLTSPQGGARASRIAYASIGDGHRRDYRGDGDL